MDKKIISIPKLVILSFIIMISSFVLFFNRLPPQIPLFYSQSEGEGAIADTIFIFILPLISLTLLSINTILKKRYFNDQPLLEHIFYYTNIVIIITTTLIFIRIIFLVT